jgi:cytochrome o ubiquinol oxidase subunit 2
MKRKRIAASIAAVVGVIVAIVVLIVYLHSVNIPVLEPQGPVAAGEKSVILITLALCSIVVVPVFVLLFFFAWKYRADSSDSREYHEPEWDHYNALFEFLWWLVPSAIVFALGILAVQSSHTLDPYVPLQGTNASIEVEVVALDWKWLFIYPEEGIASVNELEFPEGSPIHFELTADAPMNSFWIPALGGQIMVMPGMTTQLNLLADGVGTYNGVSGNISGRGFAGMTFAAKSVSLDAFNAWVQSVQASSSPLSQSAYDALANPSQNNPVAYYSPVDPNLYTGITMKYMMPASSMIDSSVSRMNEIQTGAMSGMNMQ